MARGDVYDELARRIRRISEEHAHRASPPVERFKVIGVTPLELEQIHGDLMLHQHDPDVEIARHLLVGDHLPEVGDTVIVHTDRHGDYIVSAIADDGED